MKDFVALICGASIFALSCFAVVSAKPSSALSREEIESYIQQTPECSTPAQVTTAMSKVKGFKSVRTLTAGEIGKLAASSQTTSPYDTIHIVYFDDAAWVFLGNRGKVCDFIIVDPKALRSFLQKALGSGV